MKATIIQTKKAVMKKQLKLSSQGFDELVKQYTAEKKACEKLLKSTKPLKDRKLVELMKSIAEKGIVFGKEAIRLEKALTRTGI